MTHNISNSTFTTTTDNSLITSDEPPHQIDFSYTVHTSWVKEVGYFCGFLYAKIIGLSSKEGYCFSTDSSFANELEVSLATIEKSLKRLADHNYIYRNTFSRFGQGKKRHIITKDKALYYWNSVLNKSHIPQKAKDRFMETFLNIPPPFHSPPVPSILNDSLQPSNVTDLLQPSNVTNPFFLTLKTLPEDTNTTATISGTDTRRVKPLATKSDQRQVKEAAAEIKIACEEKNAFEEEIASRLEELGIGGEQALIGISYYRAHKQKIDSARNPMGLLIHSIRNGYAADEMEKPMKKQAESKKNQTREDSNQKQAKELYNEFKQQQQHFTLKIDNYSISFKMLGMGNMFIPLGWRDKDFKQKLLTIRRTINDSIRDTRKASAVDESGTQGQQVLRYSDERESQGAEDHQGSDDGALQLCGRDQGNG